MTDAVNNPEHYRGTRWECIEIIRALNLDYWRGNALKYIVRHEKKGGNEDIAKAMWYLRHALGSPDVLISMAYNLPNDPTAIVTFTSTKIAENFGIESHALLNAIESIVSGATQAVSHRDIEQDLTIALIALKAYLNEHQAGDGT